jgi:LacI family transcriptional regulator
MSLFPTIRQVALKAGVNHSTVSLALRNDPRLRPETRAMIQAVAKEMGYRQNPTVAHLMTQLRAGKKRHFQGSIAVLNFGYTPKTEEKIWEGALERAQMLGYGLESFQVRDFPPQRLEQILVSRGVQGVIVNGLWSVTTIAPEYDSLLGRFAVCCLGIHPNKPKLSFVGDDNYNTSLNAVHQLMDLGFSRIGLAIHEGINIETEYRFVGGYLSGHLARGNQVSLPIFYFREQSRNDFLTWVREVKPQVIICIRLEMLTWLREAGFEVPRDISLVHLDLEVTPAGEWAGIHQGRALRGKIAVDLVVSLITHNEVGVPSSQLAMLTESVWVPGPTLGTPAKGKTRPVGHRP